MSLDRTTRKVVYQGDGKTTVFPFAFKVFAASDIAVEVGAPNESSSSLAYGSDYSVALNGDQEENPGGSVTVAEAPASGLNLAVVSAIPALQPMVLTPYDGFNPETLNDDSDRHVALIQQLEEQVARCVSVDATDTMTPGELKQKLLDAADDATVVAKGYAEAAKASAAEAAASEANAAASAASAADQVGRVTAEADSQIERVAAEADDQVERIGNAADGVLTNLGFSCAEQVWTADAAVESGSEMTLPNGLTYIIGRKHLRMNWNGVELQRGSNFEEVGERDHVGRKVRLLFPVSAGDELMAWTVALGRGMTDELLPLIQANSDALADLSSKVVYKSDAGESGGSTSE